VNEKEAVMGWIVFGVLALLALLIVVIYNTLVRLKVQSENAWADVDVQLKRRYDLIPNLIDTVKGYAGHERQTFEAVIAARNRAMTAATPATKAEAEGVLAQSLKSLFALAEAYPQLRAVESFSHLQGSLNHIEEAVQNARRYYNAVVRDLNTKIQEFPSNIIANFFSFKPREFFEITDASERAVPKANFEQVSR
jgi:LemA protein